MGLAIRKTHLAIFGSVIFSVISVFMVTRYADLKVPQHCLVLGESAERLKCLKPYFEEMVFRKNALAATDKARELQIKDTIDDCHLAAHFIGNAQYRKHADTLGTAFATCSTVCNEGCYHGVMEAYISDAKDINSIISDMPVICEKLSHDNRLKRQCVHGIGHGLLRHNSQSVESALSMCEGLGDDSSVCEGGVLMENMNNYLLLGEDALGKKLPQICSEVEKTQDNSVSKKCYQAIGEGLMFYTGHNLEKSIEFCRELPLQYQKTCTESAEKEQFTNRRNLKT